MYSIATLLHVLAVTLLQDTEILRCLPSYWGGYIYKCKENFVIVPSIVIICIAIKSSDHGLLKQSVF